MDSDSDSLNQEFLIEIATEKHYVFASLIADTMKESAKARGTGIGKRAAADIINCMIGGDGLIAMHKDGRWPVSVTSVIMIMKHLSLRRDLSYPLNFVVMDLRVL